MSDESSNIRESSDIAGNEIDAAETTQSAEPKSEVGLLREQLKAKEDEAKTNYDRFLRQTADLENFKKRANREREDASRFANEGLVKELLPVVDNLERAISHTKEGGDGESFVEGVEMILKGLIDALAKHGVVQITSVGQPFDPQLHEAMAQVESADHEPNTVLQEHQKGYLLKDRLLRPSLVTVVKGLNSNEKKNHNGPVENGPTDD
jgi:molecular chaperone GrpE